MGTKSQGDTLVAVEAAAILEELLPGVGFGRPGWGVQKCHVMARRGQLPNIRIGSRRYFSRTALTRWAERQLGKVIETAGVP